MSVPAQIEALLSRTAERLAQRRHVPASTYRLQFHAGFRFRDAQPLASYLRDLGITDCYASPYLKARPGSQHGYDISDHRLLNPEIGTDEDYDALINALHEHGLHHVLDVVPNHMGIVGNENVWWNDVLENGRAALHAHFFDINWQGSKPALHNKLVVPILGDPYGKSLESLRLHLNHETGSFAIRYFDHHFPVSPCSYGKVLGHRVGELEEQLGKDHADFMEYQSIRTAVGHLPGLDTTDPEKQAERHREKEVIKRRLAALLAGSSIVRTFLDGNVERFNQSGDGRPFELLDDLLAAQPYRLAWWRVASDEINFRRFFDINELAALSMERLDVFLATHELILRLVRKGAINGLRIDHPDGLFDPQQYLDRLQHHYILQTARDVAAENPDLAGGDWEEIEPQVEEAIRPQRADRGSPLWRPLYVVVEKILGSEEVLPEDWACHGATGYEFLYTVNNLFVARDHADAFRRIYKRWLDQVVPYREMVFEKKNLIMQVSMSAELNMLAIQLDSLSEKNTWSRDFTLNSLRRALRDIIASFEVYRSYITGRPVLPRDEMYVERAVAMAKRRNPAISGAIYDFVRDMLLLRYQDSVGPEEQEEGIRFVGKFQQLTSPVMAKGVEDTTFYVYNRLVSLNEVGGEPRHFGSTVAGFHHRSQERRQRTPYGLSATATHDTKRGEDTRARINVLSEVPKAWQEALGRWSRLNRKYRLEEDEQVIPDRNVEYFLYQTLIGAWPLGELSDEQHAAFVDRIQKYMQKAIHEAKVHTSWINPNPTYDRGIEQFISRILDRKKNGKFLADFQAFQQRISHYGFFNSLSQLLLKVASPGVPDVYQGTELWDYSLVDPDNRRPVDYAQRQQVVAQLKTRLAEGPERWPALARELAEARGDGRIKMYTLLQALYCRREHSDLFTTGEYIPVHASGDRDEHICAFLRRHEGQAALVVVPRLLSRICGASELPLGHAVWQEASLFVPALDAPTHWRNVFTAEVLSPGDNGQKGRLPLAEVFAHFPVALFLAQQG
jgi:(1->4)-alpha-D-glucan 1-alpha-D-glucosylmutase